MRCDFFRLAFLFVGSSLGVKFGPRGDVDLSVVELIQKYEYPVESHEIETSDGYLLTMFRIPHGRNSIEPNTKPVLLLHGLFGQAANYIVGGQINASLAYILADKGYDVWLANARGSTYSRKHKYMDPDNDTDFWQFGWDEIGSIDLPAKIDYILETTGQESIYFAGHSQGGTSYFVMMSTQPEYNKKIRAAVLMAPAVNFRHLKVRLFLYLSRHFHLLQKLTKALQLYELPPFMRLIQTMLPTICNEQTIFQNLCKLLYSLFSGDATQLDPSLIPILLATLSPSSTRQVLHYAQLVLAGRFQPYNFGKKNNMLRYGQDSPPDYNVSRAFAPTAVFYGNEDVMVTNKDSEELCKSLPNLIMCHMVQGKFNHLDFITGIDAVELVYKYIIDIFEQQ